MRRRAFLAGLGALISARVLPKNDERMDGAVGISGTTLPESVPDRLEFVTVSHSFTISPELAKKMTPKQVRLYRTFNEPNYLWAEWLRLNKP